MAARKRSTPPGDADAPEGTPAARDGKPDEDELARRRSDKANGTSVADRVQNGGTPEDGDDELFKLGTLEGDPKVTHKNLIKAGAKVNVKASLTTAAVPLTGGGLCDPETEIVVLVRALPGAVKQVPIHEEKGGRQCVKEWNLVQELRAIHVENASDMFNRVQVLEMLHEAGVPAATISKLLGEGPQAAQA